MKDYKKKKLKAMKRLTETNLDVAHKDRDPIFSVTEAISAVLNRFNAKTLD
jgi:hypothetical protein